MTISVWWLLPLGPLAAMTFQLGVYVGHQDVIPMLVQSMLNTDRCTAALRQHHGENISQ